MPFDLNLLSNKLRRYREQLQVSIQEISSATGIPKDTLIRLEGAEQTPTGSQILILADYYKCDYNFFISNERVATFEQTEILFRRYGESFSRDDRWSVQEFLFLCENEQYLMEQLGNHNIRHFTFVKSGNFYKTHGIEAALSLRRHLGYQFHQAPDDVFRDFRTIGLHIFRRKLNNSQISGIFVKHPVAGKCLLINHDEDIYRQRFTAAHEAAHAILDDESEIAVSFVGGKEVNLSETRANAFASHYLIPPEFLHRIPDARNWNSDKALDWAKRLKVSTSVLAYALEEADLINEKGVVEIKNVRVPKEEKVDPEIPSSLTLASKNRKKELIEKGLSEFYVRLCFDAYQQQIISYGRLSEILLVDERELSSISNLYGVRLINAD